MIVGLVGKKSAGKDTVGSILVDDHGFERHSFADPLKESAAALFGVPVGTWDALKNDARARVILVDARDVATLGTRETRAMSDMSVREFLQRYGTEAHRDVFGGTFWTDVAEARLRATPTGTNIVFTDVRFPEEAALVKKYAGKVVRVVRPSVDNAGDMHASETVQEAIEADFELWNGSTIEDLRSVVAFDIMGKGLGGGQTPASRELSRRFT